MKNECRVCKTEGESPNDAPNGPGTIALCPPCKASFLLGRDDTLCLIAKSALCQDAANPHRAELEDMTLDYLFRQKHHGVIS